MMTAKITVQAAFDVAVYLARTIPTACPLPNAAAWGDVRDALYAIANDTDAIVTEDEVEAFLKPLDADGSGRVRTFYDLSTAHVSSAARQWLEANAWQNANGKEARRVAAFATGWIMWIPIAADDNVGCLRLHDDIPSDLVPACLAAKRAGCDYLMFDADAPESDLPIYEEPGGDSLDGLTDEEKAAMALADEGGLHDELEPPAVAIHPEDGQPMPTMAEIMQEAKQMPADPGDGVAHVAVPPDSAWQPGADAFGGSIDAYIAEERAAGYLRLGDIVMGDNGHLILAGTGILALLQLAHVDEPLVKLIGERLGEGAMAKIELRRLTTHPKVKDHGPTPDDRDFLLWIRDRLTLHWYDKPDLDFIWKLEAIAMAQPEGQRTRNVVRGECHPDSPDFAVDAKMVPELKLAVANLLLDVDDEIEQRKNGDGENWTVLEGRAQRVRAAMTMFDRHA